MDDNTNYWFDKLTKEKCAYADIISEDSSDTLAAPVADPDCTGDYKVFEIGRHDAIIEYSNRAQCNTSESELLKKYVSDYNNDKLVEEINKQTEVLAVYNINDDSRKTDNLQSFTSRQTSQIINVPVNKQKSFSDRFLPSRILKRKPSPKIFHKIVEEKATYCKPVLDMYNKNFITDMMERNARLQHLVLQLVREAQKKEKFKETIMEQDKENLKQCKETKERCSCAMKSKKEFKALSKLFLKEVRRLPAPSSSGSFTKSINPISESSFKNQPTSSKTLRVRNQEVTCDILRPRSDSLSNISVYNKVHSHLSDKAIQCKPKPLQTNGKSFQTNAKPTHTPKKNMHDPSQFENRKNIYSRNTVSENAKPRNFSNNVTNIRQPQEIHYKRYFSKTDSKGCGSDPVNSVNNQTFKRSIGLVCTMDPTPTYLTYDLRSHHLDKTNGEYFIVPKYQKNKAISFSYDSVIDELQQKNLALNCNTYFDSGNRQLSSNPSVSSHDIMYNPAKKDQFINCTIETDLKHNQSIVMSCQSMFNKIESRFLDLNSKSCQESMYSELSSQHSEINLGIHKYEQKDQEINCGSDSLMKNNKSVMISCNSLLKKTEAPHQGKTCQISITNKLNSKPSETSRGAYYESEKKDQQINCILETDLKNNKSIMMSYHTLLNKIEPKNQGLNNNKYQDSINMAFKSIKANDLACEHEKKDHEQNYAIESDLKNDKSVMMSCHLLFNNMDEDINCKACQNSISSKLNVKSPKDSHGTYKPETKNKLVDCTLELEKQNKPIVLPCHSVKKTEPCNQGINCYIEHSQTNGKAHMSFNKLITELEKRIKHKDSKIHKDSENYPSNNLFSHDQESNVDKSSLLVKQSLLDNDTSYFSYQYKNQIPNQNCHIGKCILCNHFRGQSLDKNKLDIERSSLIGSHNFANYDQISTDDSRKLSYYLYNQLQKQSHGGNSNIEQDSVNIKEGGNINEQSTLNNESIKTLSNPSQRQYPDHNYYIERGSLNTQFSENDPKNLQLSARNVLKEEKVNTSINKQSFSQMELQYSSLSNQIEDHNQEISRDINLTLENNNEGSLNRTTNSLSYHFILENVEELKQQQISNERQDIILQDSINNKEKVSNSGHNLFENEDNSGEWHMSNNQMKSDNFLSLERLVREHHEAIALILQKYDFFIKKDDNQEKQVKIDHSCMTHENFKILQPHNSVNDMTQTYSIESGLPVHKSFNEKEVEAKEDSEQLIKIQDPISTEGTKTRKISSKAIVVENSKLLSNLIEIRLVKEESTGFEMMNQGLDNIEKKLETLLESMNRFMLEIKSKKSSKFFKHKKVFVNSEFNTTSLVNMATSVSVPFTRRSEELNNQQLTGSSISTVHTDCESNGTISKSINSNEYSQIIKKMNSLLEEIDTTSIKSSRMKSHHSSSETTSTPDVHVSHTHTTNILQEKQVVSEKRAARTSEIMNIAINTDPVGFLSLMKTMLSYMPSMIKQYSFIKKNERMEPTLETTPEAEIAPEPGPAMTTPPPTNELIPQTKSKTPSIARSCLLHLTDECPFDCKYCGQKFMRAYCCELHQVSCAERAGLKHDNNPKLMFLT